jgi:hypothetical protein
VYFLKEIKAFQDFKMFRSGDTVIFEPENFNPASWDRLTDAEKRQYYGDLYNFDNPSKPFLFTFLCEHHPQTGHCALLNMRTKQIEPMCHISDFRPAEDSEC